MPITLPNGALIDVVLAECVAITPSARPWQEDENATTEKIYDMYARNPTRARFTKINAILITALQCIQRVHAVGENLVTTRSVFIFLN